MLDPPDASSAPQLTRRRCDPDPLTANATTVRPTLDQTIAERLSVSQLTGRTTTAQNLRRLGDAAVSSSPRAAPHLSRQPDVSLSSTTALWVETISMHGVK